MADGYRWSLACLELKNLWVKARAGSTPAPGTTYVLSASMAVFMQTDVPSGTKRAMASCIGGSLDAGGLSIR